MEVEIDIIVQRSPLVVSANPIYVDAPSGGAVDSVDGRTGTVVLSDLYEPIDSASDAITAHVAESDPHTQYLKESDSILTAQTLTDEPTIAVDWSLGSTAVVTLGGNRALGSPTNGVTGRTYTLVVFQDGTGGRTLSFPGVFPRTPTIRTQAGSSTIAKFYFDGTNYQYIDSSVTYAWDIQSGTSGTYTAPTNAILSVVHLWGGSGGGGGGCRQDGAVACSGGASGQSGELVVWTINPSSIDGLSWVGGAGGAGGAGRASSTGDGNGGGAGSDSIFAGRTAAGGSGGGAGSSTAASTGGGVVTSGPPAVSGTRAAWRRNGSSAVTGKAIGAGTLGAGATLSSNTAGIDALGGAGATGGSGGGVNSGGSAFAGGAGGAQGSTAGSSGGSTGGGNGTDGFSPASQWLMGSGAGGGGGNSAGAGGTGGVSARGCGGAGGGAGRTGNGGSGSAGADGGCCILTLYWVLV